jgi:hypothetical protein
VRYPPCELTVVVGLGVVMKRHRPGSLSRGVVRKNICLQVGTPRTRLIDNVTI